MGTGVPLGGMAGIPADLTALVGRRTEVAEVRRLLSASRLVTLTGAGGVGKTRVALRTAATVTRAFRDGVCVVELAGLRDPKLLAHTVATALGLVNQSGRATLDVVTGHVRGRRLLLVLDNCEHLVDACARLADTLLRAAPGIRVLTTSRHVLGVTGEQVFVVPPLPTPVPSRRPSVRELLTCPAVELFGRRAAAVLPGFEVTQDNAEAVAQLVQRLDGLPLAIELAAARMRTLTLDEMLARLEDRFALLTLGSRTALPRQRTLRALMDWSHALCTERERALWARVSVFSGGFDLGAAAAVCAADDLPAEALVDVVDGLVEKSVLTRHEHGGRARYRMLETVREYGQDRLAASGTAAAYRRRHRDHYLGLTAQAQAQWFGPEQAAWFTRLRLDHANLRVALDYCLTEPGEAAAGMRLAVTPRHYWITLGSLHEGRHWLDRLLAAERAQSSARATALGTYAYLGVLQGAIEEALPALDEYRAAAEHLEDASALAWARHHQALAAAFRWDLPRAAALFEAAATGHRALGDLGGATECTVKLAIAVWHLGDHDRALALCRECEAVTSAHGESWLRALTLFARGLLQWLGGDRDTTDGLAREAIRLMRPFHDWWDIAMCVELVAWSAEAAGATRRAAHLLGILRSLWETIGGTLSAAPFMAESHQRCEDAVRAALPAGEFDRAVRRGAAFSPAAALAYVLEEAPAPAPPPPRRPAHTGPDAPLTRREREVAGLVALGLSNKEIAASLVIAQRTAENHVERILAKLGFTSRSQVAVWVHEGRRGESASGAP
ncbi:MULTISPECIES: ATP-binding protein [Streptomyces]|uniref:ATP-binding protein n=1 Tax=Streptomyces TaxID=1883 RepID=UPI000A8AA475|nr:LuxR C-terminal-related transcriptional regulator [Streptomyces sp. SID7805]